MVEGGVGWKEERKERREDLEGGKIAGGFRQLGQQKKGSHKRRTGGQTDGRGDIKKGTCTQRRGKRRGGKKGKKKGAQEGKSRKEREMEGRKVGRKKKGRKKGRKEGKKKRKGPRRREC